MTKKEQKNRLIPEEELYDLAELFKVFGQQSWRCSFGLQTL